jgi:hypothetical protein
MEQCTYEAPGVGRCRHVASTGGRLCVFHLPLADKVADEFWRQLACYLETLREASRRLGVHLPQPPPESWLRAEVDARLTAHYRAIVQSDPRWNFNGFRFPAMDDVHNFEGVCFDAPDFRAANFARGLESEPDEETNEGLPRTAAGARVSDTEPARPTVRRSADGTLPLSDGLGPQNAPGQADFSSAHFIKRADFAHAVFDAGVDFSGATFDAGATFNGADFWRPSQWNDSRFDGPASFFRCTFGEGATATFVRAFVPQGADFTETTFTDDVDMTEAETGGEVRFIESRLARILRLHHVVIEGRLLFDAMDLGARAGVLLWDAKFRRGRLTSTGATPQGDVVVQNMPSGVGRMSFLRTDIMTDRQYVRFVNVKWASRLQPHSFSLDAAFIYRCIGEWGAIGLGTALTTIERLFNQPPQSPELEALVRQDAERIVREIRRAYEAYGCYSDAGDFHVVEMDFRRSRTPWRHWPFRLALELYGFVSMYGESPSSALRCLLGIWALAGLCMLYSGFVAPSGYEVNYAARTLVDPRWAVVRHNIPDLGRALLYSLVNLIPGYFRFAGPSAAVPTWTAVTAVVEGILGASVIALLLLAIRGRFKR